MYYQEEERCGGIILHARVRRNRARRISCARYLIERDGCWLMKILTRLFL